MYTLQSLWVSSLILSNFKEAGYSNIQRGKKQAQSALSVLEYVILK